MQLAGCSQPLFGTLTHQNGGPRSCHKAYYSPHANLGQQDSLASDWDTHSLSPHHDLPQVLDIDYSSSDINLREADFSCNCLLSLRDLSGYSRLQSLRLDRNRLESFVGLRSLGMLRSLSVTHNQVRSCAGLEGEGSEKATPGWSGPGRALPAIGADLPVASAHHLCVARSMIWGFNLDPTGGWRSGLDRGIKGCAVRLCELGLLGTL